MIKVFPHPPMAITFFRRPPIFYPPPLHPVKKVNSLIYVLFQEDTSEVVVTLQFAMDGAKGNGVGEKKKEFRCEVFGNPKFHHDINTVMEYIPVWPCTHEHINILV